jgi:hypothetical protein
MHHLPQNKHQPNIGFVLGNGRSRLEADLESLRGKGTIYGCNALFREFHPDVLVAVDPRMIIEIVCSYYQKTNEVWTNYNTKFKEYTDLKTFKNPRGWASGPTALLKAAMDNNTHIFILGFDYTGINEMVNNVYADTTNYKRSTDPATYHGNWKKQTETVFSEFPDINFIRVVGKNCLCPPEWKMINNYKQVSYTEFRRLVELL